MFSSKRTISHVRQVCAMVVLIAVLGIAADGDSSPTSDHPLLVGQPGAGAAELNARLEKADTETTEEGIRAVVRVKSSAKGYLNAIYLAPDGDAVVLLPNAQMPLCLIQPNQEYTLFGPDSQLRFKRTDLAEGGKIVFYLTTDPITIGDLQISPGEVYKKIPFTADREIQALRKTLESLSRVPTFNRVVLPLHFKDKKRRRLELMSLPPDVTSTKPIGVTGAPGLKGGVPEPGKE
ncbi:MAG: hypothetical protein V2B18_13820 [Pseudomonadota bacterium]